MLLIKCLNIKIINWSLDLPTECKWLETVWHVMIDLSHWIVGVNGSMNSLPFSFNQSLPVLLSQINKWSWFVNCHFKQCQNVEVCCLWYIYTKSMLFIIICSWKIFNRYFPLICFDLLIIISKVTWIKTNWADSNFCCFYGCTLCGILWNKLSFVLSLFLCVSDSLIDWFS